VSDRTLRAAVVVLALVGAAISAYVLAARLGGSDLYCSTGGCETVQSSRYAELLGVPVAALGLGAYLAIAASVFAGPAGRVIGAAVALAGVVFSAYLLVVQLTVIDAVCLWCLANDAVATGLAAAVLLRLRRLDGAGGLGLAARVE
jgi:uncharacterized membrane protein